jgi:hypothetical protein
MFEEQIARGMQWLTHYEKMRLDLTRLDLSDRDWCVLGQLYNGYSNGCSVTHLSSQEAQSMGFSVPANALMVNWRALTQEWKEAIREYRAACDVTSHLQGVPSL